MGLDRNHFQNSVSFCELLNHYLIIRLVKSIDLFLVRFYLGKEIQTKIECIILLFILGLNIVFVTSFVDQTLNCVLFKKKKIGVGIGNNNLLTLKFNISNSKEQAELDQQDMEDVEEVEEEETGEDANSKGNTYIKTL